MGRTAATDPAITGMLKQPFAEQVAFFRGKLGNLLPSATWTDVQKAQHDRGFMVAGAAKADLLADLAAAVDRMAAGGKGIDDFRKDFDAAVKRHGWSYTGQRNWRTRVIYSTNMSTSYSAGRLAQLRAGHFPYWMYKHSDSVLYPRPLHVSWDGLTLPADHPWWQTHYPPNGWGCHCRVIGIRRPEDAERLGERVTDTPPDDGADAETGTPDGIDEGWDYMPGDTVADTVATMAGKTVQWENTLAKAYMQGVPSTVRDDLARAFRDLPSLAEDVARYARRVIDERSMSSLPPYRTLGLTTEADAARIERLTGQDVRLYDFALDSSAVETASGRRPMTAEDYALLPQILNGPDTVREDGGLLLYAKKIAGEMFTAVFEVRKEQRMLVLRNMVVR